MTFEDAAERNALAVARLVSSKQRDYGPNNIMKSVVRPELALAVRLTDKIARLVHLVESGADPRNESLVDTARDIMGYGLILEMVLQDEFLLPLDENPQQQ